MYMLRLVNKSEDPGLKKNRIGYPKELQVEMWTFYTKIYSSNYFPWLNSKSWIYSSSQNHTGYVSKDYLSPFLSLLSSHCQDSV